MPDTSLSLNLRAAAPLDTDADVLVLGAWAPVADADARVARPKAGAGGARTAKTSARGERKTREEGPRIAAVEALEQVLGGVRKLATREEFTAKRDQVLGVPGLGKLAAGRVFVLGLGPREGFGPVEARLFAARAAKLANAEKATSLAISLPEGLEAHARALGEGLALGAYRFTKYLTGDRRPKKVLARVDLLVSGRVSPQAKRDLELGQAIAAGVNLARDLSNEPPNVLYPETLADVAVAAAKKARLRSTVFDFREIKRRGMLLLQAVGQGSVREPRFVHLSYVPTGKAKQRLVFVGKGITFDTGGISIKPAAGMGEMKHDMSGAANVVGLMVAVAALRPNVEVHGIFAAAENMPDGNAYRPGDVWGSMDGKTVEIINTDAEGRLILADALAYARALEPDLLVDNATLTGAMLVALGTNCTGFFASNDETGNRFAAAAKAAGEQMWRMPLLEELRDHLKSDTADLKHTGDRSGGSISAALFLREFIGDTKNWVHADIAGPANADRPTPLGPKGATGHAVLTFLALIEEASGGASGPAARG